MSAPVCILCGAVAVARRSEPLEPDVVVRTIGAGMRPKWPEAETPRGERSDLADRRAPTDAKITRLSCGRRRTRWGSRRGCCPPRAPFLHTLHRLPTSCLPRCLLLRLGPSPFTQLREWRARAITPLHGSESRGRLGAVTPTVGAKAHFGAKVPEGRCAVFAAGGVIYRYMRPQTGGQATYGYRRGFVSAAAGLPRINCKTQRRNRFPLHRCPSG